MASTDQLKKVAELTDRLTGLGDKRRGNTIEATDWNGLVGVLQGVLEIDRVQEDSTSTRLEEQFAAKTHQHIGEVSKEWLDPELRQAVLASGSTVAGQVAQAEMRTRLDGLVIDVSRLTTRVEEQQKTVDRFAVNDVDRGGQVRRLEGRVVAVDGLRAVVDQVSSEFGTLRTNVQQVVELRNSLLDATGAPINVSALKNEVQDLGRLRENLSGVDGRPVRMRDVELRLNDLADSVGTGGGRGLDTRFAEFEAALDGRFTQRTDERMNTFRTELDATRAADLSRIQSETGTAVTTATTALEGRVNGAIAGVRAETTTQLETTLRGQRQQIRAEASELIQASARQQLAVVDERIATAITRRRPEIEEVVRDSLATSLAADLTPRVDALEATFAARLADTASTVTLQVSDSESRVNETVRTATSEAASAIRNEVNGLITATRDAISTQLAQQLRTAFEEEGPDFDSRIRDSVSQQLADLDGRITRAVDTATAGLSATIGAAVQQQLASADIAGQISAAVAEGTTLLRRELQTGLNQVQQNQTAAITAAVTSLRGELAAGLTNTVDTAVSRSTALVNGLREEMTVAIDRRTTEIGRRVTEVDGRVVDLDNRVTRVSPR
jgi:hypothetical protein